MKQGTVHEIRIYFQKALREFGNNKGKLFLSALFTLIIQASALLETHVLAGVTDALYQRDERSFFLFLVVTAVVGLATILISIFSAKLDVQIQLDVVMKLKERALRVLCSRKEKIERYSEGEQYSIIQEDSEAVVAYVFKIISYAFSIAVLIYIGATLVWISPMWAGSFAVIQVVVGLVQKKGVKPVKNCALECLKSENEFQRYLNEELGEMHAIRYENMKENVVAFARRNMEIIKAKRLMQNKKVVSISTASKSCMYAGKMLLFLGMGREVMAGKVTMQEYIVFYSYMSMFSGHFMSVIQMLTSLQPMLLNVKRLLGILELEEESECSRMDLEELSFLHMKKCFGEKVLFADVTMDLNMENSYAVLGMNGSGKTTFTKMLLGEESVSDGLFMIDGTEVSKMQRESLLGIRYFAANPCVLSGMTLRENIMLGMCEKPIEETFLQEICEDFLFLRDVKEMKAGMETILGNEVRLSSGQKKKVELIRAALSDAEVIILDEPLANLDEEFKGRFSELFKKYYRNRKVIVVEHDAKRVSYVDRILHISDGQIFENNIENFIVV